MSEGLFGNNDMEKFEFMAMYPGLINYADALDKNITKEQLEKYLLYDGRGRKLKIMIGQEKINYGNIPIKVIVSTEIEKQPHCWDLYSNEERGSILNLVNLLDEIDINWIE
ncbi:MAG: hypothetical protein KA146_00315 [Leptospiraceae bacterium]|nr:hypothetical protein [Leptospiraceae bacterium]